MAIVQPLYRVGRDLKRVQATDQPVGDAGAMTVGAETTVASAATTDIGAVSSWAVQITGTTAITSLGTAANRFRIVRFAGALTLTFNATSLILPTGANIVTAAGDTCIATSDASGNWRVRGYQRADGTPLVAPVPAYPNVPTLNGLTVAPGATVTTQVVLAVTSATLKGATVGLPIAAASVTISTGTVGANGLESGLTLAANTWYPLHLIAKSDGTTAGLISASATAPSLPSGYAYFARAAWVRTDASSNLVPFTQNDRSARWLLGSRTPPIVANTTVGDVTASSGGLAIVASSGFVPPTAGAIVLRFGASAASSTIAMAAPNTSYGAYFVGPAASPPAPPLVNTSGNPGPTGSIVLEGDRTTFAVACQASGVIACLGYEDIR